MRRSADIIGPALREAIEAIVDERMRLFARPAKKLYTVPAAAKFLGRTEIAIREMKRPGKLKCVKKDGRVMFDMREAEQQSEES